MKNSTHAGLTGPRFLLAIVVAVCAWGFAVEPGWSAAGKAPLETATVMAPLEIPRQISMEKFEQLLDEAKQTGVNTVSVDVWWGKVEKNGDQQFDWSYYDAVFQKIRDRQLKIVPILSFHQCGGGPGDDCDIPPPPWLYAHFATVGLTANDLKYESETGSLQDDAIPPWATAVPAVLDQFREFMQAFAAHYAAHVGDFVELNISLGPTGELRYPAYNKADGWNYPDRGFFQAYSTLAQTQFRNWALARFVGLSGVAQRWETPLAHPAEIRVPGGHLPPKTGKRAETFVNDRDYADKPYGRDFVDWYNESLVEHGRRVLVAADGAFGGTFKAIPLGMKIPGVHWQMKACAPHPRIAEITAGLVQTTLDLDARADAYGYQRILDMIADIKNQTGRDVILHFTAAEMDNDPACGDGNSMAEALVFWISQAAQDRNIHHKSENALACVAKPGDDRNWESIRNVFSNAPYQGFTLLRLVDHGCPGDPAGNPWGIDRANFTSFIKDYGAGGSATGLIVHLAEWQSCPEDQGCRYNLHGWNGLNGDFPLRYEGKFGDRHWWVGTVPNAPAQFSFTFNNTFNWESGAGQFDRSYQRATHGNEIFLIGRGDTKIRTQRP